MIKHQALCVPVGHDTYDAVPVGTGVYAVPTHLSINALCT